MSSTLTASTSSMPLRSRLMPPYGALTPPSSDVPAPNGTTGTRAAWHSASTADTSSVLRTNTTASGGRLAW
jgi:hypothetical protein